MISSMAALAALTNADFLNLSSKFQTKTIKINNNIVLQD